MATAYQHRVLFVVPAASCAGFSAWIRNNLDPTGGDWLTARLSAAGASPFTHGWCCAALTAAEFKKIMQRLCTLSGITPPTSGAWDAMTRQQKRQWFLDNRPTIRTAIGVWVVPMDNDGAWDLPSNALTVMGLAETVNA